MLLKAIMIQPAVIGNHNFTARDPTGTFVQNVLCRKNLRILSFSQGIHQLRSLSEEIALSEELGNPKSGVLGPILLPHFFVLVFFLFSPSLIFHRRLVLRS